MLFILKTMYLLQAITLITARHIIYSTFLSNSDKIKQLHTATYRNLPVKQINRYMIDEKFFKRIQYILELVAILNLYTR